MEIYPCTPGSRGPAGVKSQLTSALALCCGKACVKFALASIAARQRAADALELERRFDNDGARVPEKPWQTFDNSVASKPERSVTQPITVTTEVKVGLASVVVAVADLVNQVGRLPVACGADPAGALSAAPWREAAVVRMMVAATRGMRAPLRADPVCREMEFPKAIRSKLEALVASKALIDSCSESLSRLILDFIKVVAWHAAARAYGPERLTLNWNAFVGIVETIPAFVSAEDADSVYVSQDYLDDMMRAWRKRRDEEKKAAASKPKGTARRGAVVGAAAAGAAVVENADDADESASDADAGPYEAYGACSDEDVGYPTD